MADSPSPERGQKSNEVSTDQRTVLDGTLDKTTLESDPLGRVAADPGATQFLDYRYDSQGTEHVRDLSLERALEPDKYRQQLDPLSRRIRRFGHYVLAEKISDGGMSWVYAAYQEFEDFEKRKVILKVLQPRVTAQAFHGEVNALIELGNHPNIMFVYDGGTAIGIDPDGYRFQYQWMAMPPAGGGTLKERLELYRSRGEFMPMEEVVHVLEQTAVALDYAHQQGRVHRDIKPGNILFDQQDHVLLSDFGIALNVTDEGQGAVQESAGTPPYMAPEQWHRGLIDARTDVYGLGAMLFEMVTNEVPYPAADVTTLQRQALDGPVPSARERHGKVPGAVDNVLRQALAKEPAARFQSAGELCAAFQAAVMRRRRWATAGLSAVVLLLITSVLGYALLEDDGPSPAVVAQITAAAQTSTHVAAANATSSVEAVTATIAAGETERAIAADRGTATAVQAGVNVRETAIGGTATAVQATRQLEAALAAQTATAVQATVYAENTAVAATATEAWNLTATWEALPRIEPGIYTFDDQVATFVESANDNAGNWACTLSYFWRLDEAEVKADRSIELFVSRWIDYQWAQRFAQNPCQVDNVAVPAGWQLMYLSDVQGNKLYFEDVTGFLGEDFVMENGQIYTGSLLFPAPVPGEVEFTFFDDDEEYMLTGIRLAE